MRIRVFQHVDFEGPGNIADWAEKQKAPLEVTRLFRQEPMPQLQDFDLLVVMGGPMSANDEGALPWLRPEKEFIREAVEQGKAVVGICLGAQLIAASLGAAVYRNREKEIGWFPVEAVPVPVGQEVFRFPSRFRAFHWHGETFDLPAGAVHLARSRACINQAFQVGDRALGLQFHLEMTPQAAAALVQAGREELVPGRFVQSALDILAVPTVWYHQINGLMDQILSFLTCPLKIQK